MTLDEMIERGELERVEPDEPSALAALEEARIHVGSAQAIAAGDPNGAYQLAYDAARKAVMAHMRHVGVRIRRGEGSHALAAEYAARVLDRELGGRLDSMRRRRNRSEYGIAHIGQDEIREAIVIAERLIQVVVRAGLEPGTG